VQRVVLVVLLALLVEMICMEAASQEESALVEVALQVQHLTAKRCLPIPESSTGKAEKGASQTLS